MFLYRHRRREALDGSDSEESAGVRFSCPLARIESATFLDPLTPGLATLLINSGNGERSVRLGPVYQVPTWQKLPDILANYRKLRMAHPSALDEMPVFVDLGPITYENAESDVETADLKEKAVRNALALGAEPSLWSQLQFILDYHLSSDILLQ